MAVKKQVSVSPRLTLRKVSKNETVYYIDTGFNPAKRFPSRQKKPSRNSGREGSILLTGISTESIMVARLGLQVSELVGSPHHTLAISR